MTVKQLIAELSKHPPDMDVFMAERKTEFSYGLLNGVYVQSISFDEDPEGESTLARANVVVLDED